MLGSGGDGRTGDLGIVARLGFGGRNVADGLEQASIAARKSRSEFAPFSV